MEGDVSIRFVVGEVGKGKALLMEGNDNGGIGSPLMIGSVGKGPIIVAVGKGRTLMIEGGNKVRLGSPVSVGSASIESPVSDGFKRPSERRKQRRSLQPYGRLVTAVGAGPFRRLNERSTQSRESHLRVAVEDMESVRVAGVDGVVPIAGAVRGLEAADTSAGGGGNQYGAGNPGGGGCQGKSGLRIGSGPGGIIHGFLGSKGGNGGGGIQGLYGLGFGGGGAGGTGKGGGELPIEVGGSTVKYKQSR